MNEGHKCRHILVKRSSKEPLIRGRPLDEWLILVPGERTSLSKPSAKVQRGTHSDVLYEPCNAFPLRRPSRTPSLPGDVLSRGSSQISTVGTGTSLPGDEVLH